MKKMRLLAMKTQYNSYYTHRQPCFASWFRKCEIFLRKSIESLDALNLFLNQPQVHENIKS